MLKAMAHALTQRPAVRGGARLSRHQKVWMPSRAQRIGAVDCRRHGGRRHDQARAAKQNSGSIHGHPSTAATPNPPLPSMASGPSGNNRTIAAASSQPRSPAAQQRQRA